MKLSIRLAAALGLFCAIAACNTDVRVSMNESVPPTFNFTRNYSHVTNLDFFLVKEVAPENVEIPYSEQTDEKNKVIWQIWPKASSDSELSHLPPITYGVVPSGFTQRVPSDGKPPELKEGEVYEAGGPPIVMPKGIVRFKIVNGKAIQLPIKDMD